ncbi:substrate-binding domain-containing protein, partial [Escherichia coli]|uniref:substrate-binding domain-containing protein n=1 Tax=Escherichia coli TaxID=562 RepID=UPI00228367E2
VPVIALAEVVEAAGVDSVSSDDEGGVGKIVEHLVGLGHRRIWFCESPTSGGNAERRRGFQRALAERGLSDEACVIPAGSTAEGGADAARFIL